MKVMIVKEVMKGDVSPVAMFGIELQSRDFHTSICSHCVHCMWWWNNMQTFSPNYRLDLHRNPDTILRPRMICWWIACRHFHPSTDYHCLGARLHWNWNPDGFLLPSTNFSQFLQKSRNSQIISTRQQVQDKCAISLSGSCEHCLLSTAYWALRVLDSRLSTSCEN